MRDGGRDRCGDVTTDDVPPERATVRHAAEEGDGATVQEGGGMRRLL